VPFLRSDFKLLLREENCSFAASCVVEAFVEADGTYNEACVVIVATSGRIN
jgi:hypothetical protein